MADLVLWDPKRFGSKPELVIKSGFVAWGNTGSGSGSTRLTQPRVYRPYYGRSVPRPPGSPRSSSPRPPSSDRAARAALPSGLTYAPIRGSRGLTRADMLHNTATPRVVVPREPAPVLVDGVATGTARPPPSCRSRNCTTWPERQPLPMQTRPARPQRPHPHPRSRPSTAHTLGVPVRHRRGLDDDVADLPARRDSTRAAPPCCPASTTRTATPPGSA
ncbi:hypothetical protein [Streptomyces sp. KL116D]|uniref:hypothetical protein n=1 Tax=Streptomyces sp. KL116D TaxID=3045152 RepID=UPI003556CA3F